jgi:hypothetical protein
MASRVGTTGQGLRSPTVLIFRYADVQAILGVAAGHPAVARLFVSDPS